MKKRKYILVFATVIVTAFLMYILQFFFFNSQIYKQSIGGNIFEISKSILEGTIAGLVAYGIARYQIYISKVEKQNEERNMECSLIKDIYVEINRNKQAFSRKSVLPDFEETHLLFSLGVSSYVWEKKSSNSIRNGIVSKETYDYYRSIEIIRKLEPKYLTIKFFDKYFEKQDRLIKSIEKNYPDISIEL